MKNKPYICKYFFGAWRGLIYCIAYWEFKRLINPSPLVRFLL